MEYLQYAVLAAAINPALLVPKPCLFGQNFIINLETTTISSISQEAKLF